MRTQGLSFAALVRHHRGLLLLTQEELAEKSGLSARTVQSIEGDRVARPRRSSVQLLGQALGLTGRDLDAFERAARAGRQSPPAAGTDGPADDGAAPYTPPALVASLEAAIAHLRVGLELLTVPDRPSHDWSARWRRGQPGPSQPAR
jgi:transcriptional regulator with XRE-family HTH domain